MFQTLYKLEISINGYGGQNNRVQVHFFDTKGQLEANRMGSEIATAIIVYYLDNTKRFTDEQGRWCYAKSTNKAFNKACQSIGGHYVSNTSFGANTYKLP